MVRSLKDDILLSSKRSSLECSTNKTIKTDQSKHLKITVIDGRKADEFHKKLKKYLYYPSNTKRQNNRHLTSIASLLRQMNVKTTLCASWVTIRSWLLQTRAKEEARRRKSIRRQRIVAVMTQDRIFTICVLKTFK